MKPLKPVELGILCIAAGFFIGFFIGSGPTRGMTDRLTETVRLYQDADSRAQHYSALYDQARNALALKGGAPETVSSAPLKSPPQGETEDERLREAAESHDQHEFQRGIENSQRRLDGGFHPRG